MIIRKNYAFEHILALSRSLHLFIPFLLCDDNLRRRGISFYALFSHHIHPGNSFNTNLINALRLDTNYNFSIPHALLCRGALSLPFPPWNMKQIQFSKRQFLNKRLDLPHLSVFIVVVCFFNDKQMTFLKIGISVTFNLNAMNIIETFHIKTISFLFESIKGSIVFTHVSIHNLFRLSLLFSPRVRRNGLLRHLSRILRVFPTLPLPNRDPVLWMRLRSKCAHRAADNWRKRTETNDFPY